MTGRTHFSLEEAAEIRGLLSRVRVAERDEQKKLRSRVRSIGFRISDWDTSGAGFTRSDFDDLVRRGLIAVEPPKPDAEGAATSAEITCVAKTDAPSRSGGAKPRMVETAIAALTGPRHHLVDAPDAVPDVAGLYAIYGDALAWRELGLGDVADDRPLYVGKSEDSLIKRDVKSHFGNGQTGRSTVRRSIAALLRDSLGLRGIPRNTSNPERPTNFGLSDGHEERLGDWMQAHLSLAGWPKPDDCESLLDVEIQVIGHWRPPLNLKDNTSQWKRRVSAARQVMANDARLWAQQRGIKF